MKEPSSNINTLTEVPVERRKRLRQLIILVILISVGVHILAGIGAGIWVIARYLTQPKAQFVVQKQIKMQAEDREHRLQMEEVTSLRPKPVYNNRIQSIRPSKLALPQLPRVPLDTITPIDTEALISDQIDGMGKYGQGNGSGGGFFGGKGAAGSGLLAGGLYDLKKEVGGQKNQMSRTAYLDVVERLSRSPSADAVLKRYYKAPETLYMPQLAIPIITAGEAPKAFHVENKVQPSFWIAVYNGRVTAPDSGVYKFIGFADDILLVKINGRLVLDGSLLGATRLANSEGVSFTVEKGKAYNIEVIIGECPGGYFSAWLLIQKQGAGEKPYWFRMSDKEVKMPIHSGDSNQKFPPSQANGPVWWPAAQKNMPGLGL